MAMQSVVNKVKSAALGVADSLTPVLKVQLALLCCVNRPHALTEPLNSTMHTYTVGVQVQGDGDAYPRGVCDCGGPSRIPLSHMELVGRRAGQEEGLSPS